MDVFDSYSLRHRLMLKYGMNIMPFILKLETGRILSSRAEYIAFKMTHRYVDQEHSWTTRTNINGKFELTIHPRHETYARASASDLPYPLDEEPMNLKVSYPSIYVKHAPKGDGDLTLQIAVDLFGSPVPKHTDVGAVGLYREDRHNSFLNLGDPEFFDKYEDLIKAGLNERALHPFEGGFGKHYLLYAAIASPAVETRIKYLSLRALLEKMREDVPMARLNITTEKGRMLRVTFRQRQRHMTLATFRLTTNRLKANIHGGRKIDKRAASLSAHGDIKAIIHLLKNSIKGMLGYKPEPMNKHGY